MADKCSPVRLPIKIEASCNSENNCDCTETPLQTKCVISMVPSSQNTFQNTCTDSIEQQPSIDIAYLSNVRHEKDADLSVTLNPTILSWCDFLTLFYRANNVFSVNPTNQTACAINFVSQTYENTTNKKIKFNLAQQVRIAWANKCETTIDSIPAKSNILLNKDTFSIRSLMNNSSAVSLTLDQAIQTLLANGEIGPGDSTDIASVRFVVQYKYCFKPLDTCVLVNFVFVTGIPCYKNLNFCDDWCPVYSSDKGCRNCPELADETKDIMSFLNKNFKKNAGGNMVDDSSEAFENMSTGNLSEFMGENTVISVDSSNW
jgi:hypothetical protein